MKRISHCAIAIALCALAGNAAASDNNAQATGLAETTAGSGSHSGNATDRGGKPAGQGVDLDLSELLDWLIGRRD